MMLKFVMKSEIKIQYEIYKNKETRHEIDLCYEINVKVDRFETTKNFLLQISNTQETT